MVWMGVYTSMGHLIEASKNRIADQIDLDKLHPVYTRLKRTLSQKTLDHC